MKRVALFVIFPVLALTSLGAHAQERQPPPPPPTGQQTVQPANENDVVRITTNLIQVDAVVTDKSGKVVTDLKPEDFEVLVNGKPQPITNFSFVSIDPPPPPQPPATPAAVANSNRSAPPIPVARLRADQVKRTIALVVDDLTIDCENLTWVRRALQKFVDEQMQPGDLVAIMRTGSSAGALQLFTSNKEQLNAAVERVTFNPGIGKCFGGSGRFNSSQDRDISLQIKGTEIDEGADDLKFRSEVFSIGTLGATEHVIRGMRGLPGRKAVMLLSEGFPSDNSRIRDALRRLGDVANRSGVVIYTMDARGLVSEGLTAADAFGFRATSEQISMAMIGSMKGFTSQLDGLIFLAKQTGGFAVYNSNDVSGGIRKVLDDQKHYYLIGFQPDPSTFDATRGRYNHLTVKVKRSDLTVRFRSGFFGIKDEEPKLVVNTAQRQIMKALTSPFASGDISLRLTPLFGNDAKSGSFVRSLVHIATKNLTFTDKPDGSHEAIIDVVAYTFGDNGIVVDSAGATHTLTLTDKLYQRALSSGFVYSLNVPIKTAGAYQFRVAVRDSKSEKVGSASQFINIPNLKKDRLALSGIALSSYDSNEGKNSANAVDARSTSDTAGDSALTQAALRRFRAGQVLRFTYAIYNARVEKRTRRPSLTTRLKLYREGQEIFTGQETPYELNAGVDLDRLLAEGGLQLGGLKVGEYVIQISVTDLLANGKHKTTTNWIDFEIVR